MISWLLLLAIFCQSTQAGHGQENGVLRCGPQNLILTSSDQRLLLTWEDHPSCSSLHDPLTYELMVLIADTKAHYDEVAVPPDQIGSTHYWNWTSHLPLECASHSVRLTARYNNNKSPWKEERTLPGIRNIRGKEIYPKDKDFEVGSMATFCCIVPTGQSFENMYLSGNYGTKVNTTKISDQTYAITFLLNHASDRCVDVKCKTNRTTGEYGACTYIGYPPDDRDLRCETRDLKSVECHWIQGRNTDETVYHLLERKCESQVKESCSQMTKVESVEKNWTLTAQNSLGKVVLQDTADLTKRVYMFAPEEVTAAKVNARNVSLTWSWRVEQYNNLNLTCQVNIIHSDRNTTSETSGIGLSATVLNNLIPDYTHSVKVRCRTAQQFWKWGDWSKSVSFHTYGDVPDGLDVWIHVKENKTVVMWKMLQANQSHGQISHYNVTIKTISTGQQHSEEVTFNKYNFSKSLETNEEHLVTVTAWNLNGSSPPSTIVIPSFKPDKAWMNTSWITGNERGFSLSWPNSSFATCGYVVDWCPSVAHGTVDWVKLSPDRTSVNITSENFIHGLRYSLSVYACTQGAPVLLQKREGYVKEKKIEGTLFKSLQPKQQNSDVKVSWDPFPLKEQTALIHGYIMYYWNDKQKVFSVSTDNPEATSLTAKNLKMGSYTFTVAARTAVGECGNTTIVSTLSTQTDNLIKTIFISIGAVFVLLSLTTIICYRHWECMKHKVYPPVPKPVLSDKWLAPHVAHCSPHLHTDLSQQIEDNMDIPQFYKISGELLTESISQKDVDFTLSQTPKGYYNNPLKKRIPPPFSVPTTVTSSPPGFSSSPFRAIFPNPSYNLTVQSEKQQFSSESEIQEGTPTPKNADGYQPQGHSETDSLNQIEEEPDSPISCVSTYILLPQSTAT